MQKTSVKKRVMILGAGVYQVPLIKTAKKMDLETVVVSRDGAYPGIALSDIFLDIDTTDSKGILRAAQEYAISGIVTTGTDVCIPAMGKVIDALGLKGTGWDAACRSMDKVLMKRSFKDHNVPTARFEAHTDFQSAKSFMKAHGYPVMVKAADSSGSRGITLVHGEQEFAAAWERAYSVSRSKQIIIEEFLEGVEFGAQAFVHGKQVVAVFPHDDTVTDAPFFTPIGHAMPMSLTEKQIQETWEIIEKAVRALGMRDCVSNVDLMMVDGMPIIIEIAARMGATCLPENVSIYAGFDAYKHLLLLSLGYHGEVKVTANQPNACMLLRAHTDGIVEDILIPDQIRKYAELADLQIDVKPGDSVHKFRVGPDRTGHVIVTASSAIEANNLAKSIADDITFIISDSMME